MKCEECEPLLARGEVGSEAEAHLAACPSCRSLAAELRANAHGIRALGEEVPPPARMRERGLHTWNPGWNPWRNPWRKWSSAAAALIATLAAAWWTSRPSKPAQIVSVEVKVMGIAETQLPLVPAEIPNKLTPAVVRLAAVTYTEPLRVKMLTPDPDVVIYWLVDPKEE